MRFSPPLIPGLLHRRYKRFLADVEIEGHGIVRSHCPNPGAMTGLTHPGNKAWLRDAQSPKRKLRWSLELLNEGETLVGIHAGQANTIVAEALEAGHIDPLSVYLPRPHASSSQAHHASTRWLRREVTIGQETENKSRIDFVLHGHDLPPCLLEVKSVTLAQGQGRNKTALFPDAKTTRGARHLRLLESAVQTGHRAVCLFLVQRSDCHRFAIADDIDPDYARSFHSACHGGVEMLCYDCAVSTDTIRLRRPLPIDMR